MIKTSYVISPKPLMVQDGGWDIGKVPVVNVYVWTPSGQEVWSGNVDKKKAQQKRRPLTAYQHWEEIRHSEQHGKFVPSSGLWYQTRARLQKEKPDIEKDFVTGEVEDTSTLLKYLKSGKKFADGLLIQYPYINPDGTDYQRDERGTPKARQIWQMALPLHEPHIRSMPKELDPFLNAVYGMEGAREQLPNSACVSTIAVGEKRVIHGDYYYWLHRGEMRFHVCGYWASHYRVPTVGFREFEGGEDSIRKIDARGYDTV